MYQLFLIELSSVWIFVHYFLDFQCQICPLAQIKRQCMYVSFLFTVHLLSHRAAICHIILAVLYYIILSRLCTTIKYCINDMFQSLLYIKTIQCDAFFAVCSDYGDSSHTKNSTLETFETIERNDMIKSIFNHNWFYADYTEWFWWWFVFFFFFSILSYIHLMWKKCKKRIDLLEIIIEKTRLD